MQNIVEDEVVKSVIQDGLSQVDENLIIDEFDCAFDATARKLRTHVKAVNKETAETIEIDSVF